MNWDALQRLAKLAHPWALEIRVEADKFDDNIVLGIRMSAQDQEGERPKMYVLSRVVRVFIERAKLHDEDDVERYVGRMIEEGNAYFEKRKAAIARGETP